MLAQALQDSRRDTLTTFDAYQRCLPGLQVPLRGELNPPLWELGHIGWFQEFWLARNPQWRRGAAADPLVPRSAPRRAAADRLYDSSAVPHDSRWQLPLPDVAATRDDLAAQLQDSLALLQQAPQDNDGLYFFRLALLHEDMHHEAALYMARGLGVAIDDARWAAPRLPEPPPALQSPGGPWRLGSTPAQGFAFDNELPGRDVLLPPFEIDAQVLRWAEYLPFVDSGAHHDRRFWTDEGWAWRNQQADPAPLYLRRQDAQWQQCREGRWLPLDLAEPAVHLSAHEARAWCAWAGRRLPTEAEWECATLTLGSAFRWGDVWEWTASRFEPFDGFRPHPYRDYSAPWFDGRPVLRGASHLTQPRMKHPRYRNFFPAHRRDVPAGLRTCARAG